MSKLGKSRAAAGFVSIAGVIAIWAMSAMRQQGQTEALARQWVGEQWDVARRCLVGTPVGRSEGAEGLAEKLEHELVWSIATDAPEGRWPARCAHLLPSLRADPSILRADPGDALSTLEVLAPRVLQPNADDLLSMRDAAARARELAEPIALLDAAMPSGAEYDPRSFARSDLGVPASAVLASLGCPAEVEPSRDPLAWDEDAVLSLDEFGLALRDVGGTEVARLPLEERFDRLALCRAEGIGHIVVAGEERSAWIAWSGSGTASPVAITPAPRGDAVLACDRHALIIAWRDEAAWRGARCEDGRCAALPPFEGGLELSMAVAGESVMAVAPAPGTDLPLARVLRGDAWSDPVPVARGALSVQGGAFRIATCGARFQSDDGLRWAPR